jgi:hypothetical protein
MTDWHEDYDEMTRSFDIRSGRRTICRRTAVSPQEAVLDYVRSFGSRDAEIARLGIDRVSWRGAVFQAVPSAEPDAR